MLPSLLPLVVGLSAGALINYLADVLPTACPLRQPVCWNCRTALSWSAYLRLAPCPRCIITRRPRAYLVQLAMPVYLLYLWLVPAHDLEFIWAASVFSYLVLVAVIDIEHRLVLRLTTVPGLVLGLGIGIHLHGIASSLIGGILGFGMLQALYLLGVVFVHFIARCRPSANSESALGSGDVILGGILGLLLGWPAVVVGGLTTLLIAGLVSFCIVGTMIIRGEYRPFVSVPFGSFMALSVVMLLFRP